ncbi:C40 family peptidase [Leminorella grimontii]|uniref:C40 family peptidase n=1 Tax=Leminorella grimontii TaxID=82981 RepID=UPI0003FB7D68|nr:YafL family lipoprotein [Leminorella grimontii ATCC 33999 = DSM 5078]VFS55193.1 Probable endopeptidase YafL precursor [Leminorella grimontii]
MTDTRYRLHFPFGRTKRLGVFLFALTLACPLAAKQTTSTAKVKAKAHKVVHMHPHKPPAHVVQPVFSHAALQRMHNREMLLAKYHTLQEQKKEKMKGVVFATKSVVRAQNRKLVEQHPEWFTPYRAPESHEPADSEYVQNVTDKAITRLEDQLGKPYVWGGETPQEGFDCSGLVFYAYNRLLAAKLPRTADQMYHYPRARPVNKGALRRGDLIFFHIHSTDHADHVGVYLGNGRFIEAPRTGERIRISDFSNDFWQDHYLGARRVLSEDTVL